MRDLEGAPWVAVLLIALFAVPIVLVLLFCAGVGIVNEGLK